MHHYHINIFWSDEDGCWLADVPDLRYCTAHGPTPEQALREVQTAMVAWLESARARGDPIPEPRYRPAIYAAGDRPHEIARYREPSDGSQGRKECAGASP